MTARIPENVSTWLVDWRIATIMGNTMPFAHPVQRVQVELIGCLGGAS